jgi:uncharacterized protein (DUF1697 family)
MAGATIAYVALLRAVNVGGTGKLPMTDLKRMGEEAGFAAVRTYIASGNLLFRSDQSEAGVRAAIEQRLADYAGKPVGVHVRTVQELADVIARNPFADRAPNRVTAVFIDGPIGPHLLERVTHQQEEEIALGDREIFIHYGDGMAQSRLRIPAAEQGTARNMNTVAKLAELGRGL